MPCLLVLAILAAPRVVLVLMFLFSHYLERAYHGLLVPVLGFIFLPITTIIYAWIVNTGGLSNGGLSGINLILIIIAVVVDVGGWSGGEYHRRRWN